MEPLKNHILDKIDSKWVIRIAEERLKELLEESQISSHLIEGFLDFAARLVGLDEEYTEAKNIASDLIEKEKNDYINVIKDPNSIVKEVESLKEHAYEVSNKASSEFSRIRVFEMACLAKLAYSKDIEKTSNTIKCGYSPLHKSYETVKPIWHTWGNLPWNQKNERKFNPLFGYIITNDEEVVIVFRGTKTNMDWGYNINTLFSIQYGYYLYLTGVFTSIQSVLEKNRNKKITTVGHSMGGALALLFAFLLAEKVLENPSASPFKDLKPSKLEVYTFGAPYFLSSEYIRDNRTELISLYMFRNIGDFVPDLSLEKMKDDRSLFRDEGNIDFLDEYFISASNYIYKFYDEAKSKFLMLIEILNLILDDERFYEATEFETQLLLSTLISSKEKRRYMLVSGIRYYLSGFMVMPVIVPRRVLLARHEISAYIENIGNSLYS